MAKKKFSKEEMDILRANPYVVHVSPNFVHFSAEFKEKFWNLRLERKSASEAARELGIDPDIIGEGRINGLRTTIKNEARSGNGFVDISAHGEHMDYYINPDARMKYLEQRLAYKEQEIEFLKKIVSLGKAGGKR